MGGNEHGVDGGLSSGHRRTLSLERAGKRATWADMGAGLGLLRSEVRDFLTL